MKAIQTCWKGYHFRSRLEARWAVFFDRMGFTWEYEPEGFVLPGGLHYLPDFRVATPQGAFAWYEVKPVSTRNDAKFEQFSRSQPEGEVFRSALLSGDPVDHFGRSDVLNCMCPRCGLIGPPDYGVDSGSYGCQPCDFETPCGGDNAEEEGVLGVKVTPHKGQLLVDDDNWEKIVERVVFSARAARSARFEHGEAPA